MSAIVVAYLAFYIHPSSPTDPVNLQPFDHDPNSFLARSSWAFG